ncbi:hypothetical protein TrRE_jg9176, partial [Triparma retinervis]
MSQPLNLDVTTMLILSLSKAERRISLLEDALLSQSNGTGMRRRRNKHSGEAQDQQGHFPQDFQPAPLEGNTAAEEATGAEAAPAA